MQPRCLWNWLLMSCAAVAAAQTGSQVFTIPAGTSVAVRTIDRISSKKADLNREYAASIADAVLTNGVTAIPRGARAVLTVEQVKGTKGLWGRASLNLKLTAVVLNEQRVDLQTDELSSQSASQAKKTATYGGIGAAAGAGIGALAGGGFGAAIGALAGGTAGAAEAGIQHERVNIEPETRLVFTLTQPASLHSVVPVTAEKAPAPLIPPPPPPPQS